MADLITPCHLFTISRLWLSTPTGCLVLLKAFGSGLGGFLMVVTKPPE